MMCLAVPLICMLTTTFKICLAAPCICMFMTTFMICLGWSCWYACTQQALVAGKQALHSYGILYHFTSHTHNITPRRGMSYHIAPCEITSYHTMSQHVTSHHTIVGVAMMKHHITRVIYHVTSRHTSSCHVVSHTPHCNHTDSCCPIAIYLFCTATAASVLGMA